MAISLGFGVLFSTFVTLVLVPATYMLVEDVRRFFARIGEYLRVDEAPPPAQESG
jgi:Flp pilus assembly pilin Flp